MKEKLDELWQLLGCSNADIARLLDCSPTLISRIRNGSRNYSPASRPIQRLADGIYRYADSKNQTAELGKLCGAKGDSCHDIVSALTAWLFGIAQERLPQSRQNITQQKHRFFGERLNNVMNLLDLSNMQLAKKINMDASAVSRFRNGVRSPKPPASDILAAALLDQAAKQGKTAALRRLCDLQGDTPANNYSAFASWLYGGYNLSDVSGIDSLLDSIEHFLPVNPPPHPEEIRLFATDEILGSRKHIYWGTSGLREAVIRFLGTAAVHSPEGGELCLYSSQGLEWMTGDTTFQMKWAALMSACIGSGIRIRIIHNIDRGVPEMLAAIKSWLPLYMSGMIEPFVWQGGNEFPFSRTIFLQPDRACISAALLKDNEQAGWYEYITDQPRLDALARDYNGLLAKSAPLAKIFYDDYQGAFETGSQDKHFYILLSTLSLGTMPKKLLSGILERNDISAAEQNKIREAHAYHQKELRRFMKKGKVIELLALPIDEMLLSGEVRINLFQSFSDKELYYTPEEYTCHIEAVKKLISQEANYELVLLPELPFDRIQITETESRITVLRSERPCAVFTLSEPHLVRAFHEYISLLLRQYQSSRHSVLQKLERFSR